MKKCDSKQDHRANMRLDQKKNPKISFHRFYRMMMVCPAKPNKPFGPLGFEEKKQASNNGVAARET